MEAFIETKSFKPSDELRSCILQYGLIKIKCHDQKQLIIKTFPFALTGMSIGLHGSKLHFHNTELNMSNVYSSSLMGLYPIETHNFLSPTSANTYFVNIVFTYEGLSRILGISMKELCMANIGLDCISLQNINTLIDQLENSENELKINDSLNNFFILRLRRAKQVKDPFVGSLFQTINNCNNIYSVRNLAMEMNLHVRSLERNFTRDIGLSPKEFLRITRFIRLKSILTENPNLHWSDIINACGFYDQAHLAHEIKKVANISVNDFINLIQIIK